MEETSIPVIKHLILPKPGDPAASWAKSVRRKVWDSHPRCEQQLLLLPGGRLEPPTIFRVPQSIRECDPSAYGPSAVSLGSYGARCSGGTRCLEVGEEHKRRSALLLVSRHGGRRKARMLLDGCLAAVRRLERRARGCYSGDLSPEFLRPEEFSEMLLIDGCFILHFLFRQLEKVDVRVAAEEGVFTENDADRNHARKEDSDGGEEEEGEEIMLLHCSEENEIMSMGGMWIWSHVKHDLLKLENQIPFFVLQTLFDLLKTPGDAGFDLVELALSFFKTFHPHRTGPLKATPRHDEIHHLLHLYHISLSPALDAGVLQPPKDAAGENPRVEWIPTATELQEAGVKFRRKPDAYSFLDVTFEKGVMEVPTLLLCKYSHSTFRNLMAFEQCYPVRPHVTNYALFMDCLLRSGAREVRLLHLKGIVVNAQGGDEEAAAFFNQLGKKIHYGYDACYLEGLFADVMRHHNCRWNRWRAALVREYFSNPWVITSVAVAVVLLLLTVEQAFFAAYDYFFPPK